MMDFPPARSMGEPAAPGILQRFALVTALLLLQSSTGALRAEPADPPYPATSLFRRLQLSTFDCGRENTAASCAQARSTADSLLDHPRLPGRCKDILWDIRQNASVAPVNSLERREPIDAAGREVVAACRQLSRPAPKSDTPATAPRFGGGGFGFGTGSGSPSP